MFLTTPKINWFGSAKKIIAHLVDTGCLITDSVYVLVLHNTKLPLKVATTLLLYFCCIRRDHSEIK
jgi:hypothetical protein